MSSLDPSPTSPLGAGAHAGIGLAYAVAATLLTWPLVASPGEAISVRGDYFVFIWNFWWFNEALFDPDLSIFGTDFLHFPLGVSLVRHTLTPVNSIPGALLSQVVGLHDAFKILVWIHFWLSGWVFFLFARELSGSRGGALLAGLFWSFCPFHFYYLAELNVASLEFLPLLGLFAVRSYRGGGFGNTIGLALAAALLAASSSYSLVYGALLVAGLGLGGRFWDPAVPWRRGLRRLLLAGALSGASVALIRWPLLAATFAGEAHPGSTAALKLMAARSNDLLGFRWVGAPESVLISWPTMLGYTGSLLAALGLRRDPRRLFWLALCAFFLVLSLGPVLHVARMNTGVPLPYRLFAELPGLWMLRKPDRIFVMAQLAVGVLVAFGWRELSRRASALPTRTAAWLTCATLLSVETAAIPLETFPLQPSPVFEKLARADDLAAVVHLPHYGGGSSDWRANFLQTVHGKKVPQGYVVSLALSEDNRRSAQRWKGAHLQLIRGNARPLVELARHEGVDALVLHKTALDVRPPHPIHGSTVWAPFVSVRRPLVAMRQRGHLVERPIPGEALAAQKRELEAALGPPRFEDAAVVVFNARGPVFPPRIE